MAQPRSATSALRSAAVVFLAAAIWLFAFARAAMAEPAARAQFVSGAVTLLKADGTRVAIQRGSELEVGETILTGADRRVHVRFTDGGYVSLIPNAELRLDDYRYSGQPDGKERIDMRLLKGGLRTVTGAIGKAMQSAYEMSTKVATIGIRGTEYTLLYLPHGSVTGAVGSGRIEVCNSAGCLEVGAGKSFLVNDQNTKPALTDKAADLGAPAPGASSDSMAKVTGPGSSSGEQVDFSYQTWQSLAESPDSPGGDPTQPVRGIGYELIGITAPDVDLPVRGLVSDFLHQGIHPGNGWGPGGNPDRGGPR